MATDLFTKPCSGCGECKPWDAFGAHPRGKFGLQSKCYRCVRARVNAWNAANAEHVAMKKLEWARGNKDKTKASVSNWRAANRERVAEIDARHRAEKMAACPAWADRQAIRDVYAEAQRLTQETGVLHAVDHIVPLRNDMVCGLHVPANLQVLTQEANRAKHNRFSEVW